MYDIEYFEAHGGKGKVPTVALRLIKDGVMLEPVAGIGKKSIVEAGWDAIRKATGATKVEPHSSKVVTMGYGPSPDFRVEVTLRSKNGTKDEFEGSGYNADPNEAYISAYLSALTKAELAMAA